MIDKTGHLSYNRALAQPIKKGEKGAGEPRDSFVPSRETAPPEKEWTILAYLAGSNELREHLSGNLKEMEAGLSFQLPLYLLAVREFLGLTPIAGVYYRVRSGRECLPDTAIADAEGETDKCYPDIGAKRNRRLPDKHREESLPEFIEAIGAQALAVVESIRGGEFPLTSRNDQQAGCNHCAFRAICRLPESGGGK